MGAKTYTIGDLARLSGQPVRRIRFYSDKGLLPPTLRSAANYRVYTDEDVAKLDLIHALREAGVGLDMIRRLLARRLSLHEVLRTRLEILEAEIAAKHRVATILRATLRIPNPADGDLRRIWTMSILSNQQMKALAEQFVDAIAAGTALEGPWRRQILAMSVPELPEDPTPDQIAAWDELSRLLADPTFIREVQEGTKAFWTDALDPGEYQVASRLAYEKAADATARDLSPRSPEAQAIARTWLADSAHALGRTPDSAFRDWHVAQYERNAGRLGRYRELLGMLGKDFPIAFDRMVWRWLNDALTALQPLQ
ncbi:MerR family transcriptional regulator [Methylobacterium brachiatum]|uniref:MerR family transcriptional regulator n=1 Tax=Methylobacterium brachiatum TaxID=269660 RepID=UPI0008EBBF23|nr:MerR family transcriptional regulator [Methylobacterium brachiatum]SFI09868.1 DNA-binding transcriptional regulator, MerR family [Methylobacterium brachiatum]